MIFKLNQPNYFLVLFFFAFKILEIFYPFLHFTKNKNASETHGFTEQLVKQDGQVARRNLFILHIDL